MINANNLMGKLTANAELLSIAAGIYGRSQEGDYSIGDILKNSLFETVKTFHSMEQIKYKLWDAPHVPQALVKVGAGLVLASEFGLLKKRSLGMKILKGGLLTAVITPGSGPADSSVTQNFRQANYAYQY